MFALGFRWLSKAVAATCWAAVATVWSEVAGGRAVGAGAAAVAAGPGRALDDGAGAAGCRTTVGAACGAFTVGRVALATVGRCTTVAVGRTARAAATGDAAGGGVATRGCVEGDEGCCARAWAATVAWLATGTRRSGERRGLRAGRSGDTVGIETRAGGLVVGVAAAAAWGAPEARRASRVAQPLDVKVVTAINTVTTAADARTGRCHREPAGPPVDVAETLAAGTPSASTSYLTATSPRTQLVINSLAVLWETRG